MLAWRVLLFVLLLLAGANPARALDPALEALEPGERGRVIEVVDGDTVVLERGLQVRLVGLQAPKLPLGRAGFRAWPLADQAKAALEAIALGHDAELRYGGRRRDRHGRALAHLVLDGGLWAQGAMIDAGLARVYSFPDNRALVTMLLAREVEARAARRGIWSNPFYAIRKSDEAADHLDEFALVEGRVLKVARARGRTYLNFGADYRSDFTVSIAAQAARLFETAGIELRRYEGQIIRVRGWVDSLNGAMIEATHPEQIELVP